MKRNLRKLKLFGQIEATFFSYTPWQSKGLQLGAMIKKETHLSNSIMGSHSIMVHDSG